MKRTSSVVFVFLALLVAVSASTASAQTVAASTADAGEQQSIASADLSKSRELTAPTEGQKQYDAGARLYDYAKFAEALIAFKEASKVRPNDAQVHFMQGMAEARLQLYKEAVDSFRRAVRIKPDWPEAQFRLGIVSHVTGRRVLAIDAYTSLVKAKSPLASTLYRVINEDKNRSSAQISVGDEFWSYAGKPGLGEENVPTSTEKTSPVVSPAKETITSAQPENSTPADNLSDIYRIGVGDVLDIRLLNSVTPRSTLYTVVEGGLIDYPVAGGAIVVAGRTTEEVQALLAAELKRRAVEEGARVTVGVRQYASHSVSISGLVNNPGTRFLRREAVPLYVVMTEAQVRHDAGRVVIMRAGGETTLDLSEPASLNFLIKSGDLISVTSRPQQFYYIGGRINYPGPKVFQSGLTLLQAILAAGGPARHGDNLVEISRETSAGRLGTTKYSLKDIKAGKVPDPRLQPGDRIDVVR